MQKKECNLTYEKHNRCLWMNIGLVSYKLCANDYRCEECMFDLAMRNEAVAGDVKQPSNHLQAAASLKNASSSPIMGDFFYHQNHCWAKVENSNEVKIGINGILSKLIGGIKTVVLPQAGESVSQGQCFAHIIQEKYILQLISPVSGSIQSVNHRLEKTPRLLIDDFWLEGWLVTIKPENMEHDLRTLIFGKRAIDWYKNKELEIINISNDMLNQNRDTLGLTMQDGGEIIANLADILTTEQYYHILESLSQVQEAT